MSKVHRLKSWPEYFHAVKTGKKDFEVRENDRDFQVGDLVVLQEFQPNTEGRGDGFKMVMGHPQGVYTDRQEVRWIKYVQPLEGFGVVLGLRSDFLGADGDMVDGARTPDEIAIIKQQQERSGSDLTKRVMFTKETPREQVKEAMYGQPGQIVEVDRDPGESLKDAFTRMTQPATPRYVANGAPLTDHERELLVILMEEASEVVQAASKLIRFGKENRPVSANNFDPVISNTEYLALEIGDFKHMMHVVAACGLVDEKNITAGEMRNGERLAKYLQNRAPPSC